MSIDDIRPGLARADAAHRRPLRHTQLPGALSVHGCKLDVDRSPAARRPSTAEDDSAASLPADRLLELRRWLAARGYDAPRVVDEVARSLIARRVL